MGLRGKGATPLSRMALDDDTQVQGAKEARERAKVETAATLASDDKQRIWKDESRSTLERVEAFIESRKLTQAPHAGKPFILRDFQKQIVRGVYREIEGKRVVRTALLTMGRKNGKTELAAVLAATHLFGPMSESRGEVFSAASDRNQAARIFRELEAIILADPETRCRVNIQRFAKKIEVLAGPGAGSTYEALSSDARKAHSLNPSFVVCDEPAQWPSRELYDNLITGTGARENPLVMVIGTQSDDPQHFFSELIGYGEQINSGEIDDPSFFAAIFSTPLNADIWDEKNWYTANPALGDFRGIDEMRRFATQAKRMPARETTFRQLYLNQPVQSHAGLISRVEWLNCHVAQTIVEKEEIYLGLDLSGTTDLCAMVAVSAKDGDRLKSWFWKPADLVEEHENRDRAPYRQWVKQQFIEAVPGKAIDFAYVAKRVAEMNATYKILGLAYDRWRIKDFIRELKAVGVDCYIEGDENSRAGALRLVRWGQGYADMAPAVDAFEISVLNSKLKHDGSPVLAMCVANAQVDKDAAGNRKLDKSATRFRIDGAVATVMAIGLKSKQAEQPTREYKLMFF
jgi:phage terminase large subunit-like protein